MGSNRMPGQFNPRNPRQCPRKLGPDAAAGRAGPGSGAFLVSMVNNCPRRTRSVCPLRQPSPQAVANLGQGYLLHVTRFTSVQPQAIPSLCPQPLASINSTLIPGRVLLSLIVRRNLAVDLGMTRTRITPLNHGKRLSFFNLSNAALKSSKGE